MGVGEFAGADCAQHVFRIPEPRHECREIVRQPTHAQAQRATDRRLERSDAAGAARRRSHRSGARNAPRVADDERLVRQRPAVQRPRDRHHVALAAQHERRTMVQSERE